MVELAEIGREIEARERVAGIQDAMAAAGTMEKKDRRRHMNALDRATAPPMSTTPGGAPPISTTPDIATQYKRAEGRAMLAAFGIPVVKASEISDG